MEEKPEEKILRISSKSAEYPEKLNNYPKMPEILFVKGRLPDRKKPSIAIVGARGVQHIRKDPGISICKGPQQRRSADHQRHGLRD